MRSFTITDSEGRVATTVAASWVQAVMKARALWPDASWWRANAL